MWKVMIYVFTPQWMTAEGGTAFPDPRTIRGDLIAMGGSLSPGILLEAYRKGIFPWFSDGEPILWWSLDPRFVIFPSKIHISRSLRRSIRRGVFRLTVDRAFARIIQSCREVYRANQDGTWITRDMVDAYCAFHELGYAHSVETWSGGELVGGLYGVSLGGYFCGESMFSLEQDASKIAFAALAGILADADFGLIDCQQSSRHLSAFGAVDIPRENFLGLTPEGITERSAHWLLDRDFP